MRPIDADLLKEKIEEGTIVIDEDVLQCNNIHEQLVYLLEKVEAFMVETIDDMPTVYDVDKVVEQLEKEKGTVVIDGVPMYNEDDFIDIDEAIEIVRNGGKE